MAPLVLKYKPGEKLIHDVRDVKSELGIWCAAMERFYMHNFSNPKNEQRPRFMVCFKAAEIFHHDKYNDFPVTWDDLFDMLNFRAFDTSIVRCFTL